MDKEVSDEKGCDKGWFLVKGDLEYWKLFLIITGFIGAFKAYSDVVALFGTDLNAAGMNTIVGYIYDMLYGTSGGYPSFASAAALILFAIVLTITVINLLVSKKKVVY